jgi:hypothetical protein
MYFVDTSVWIKCATMQFIGPAKRWLQTVERRLPTLDWSSLCKLLLERFGWDQHELLLRQLFQIKQTASVQEYIDKFTEIIDNLSAYTPDPDLLSYTTRFVDGLRTDIRAIILVQRPSDLDTTCTFGPFAGRGPGARTVQGRQAVCWISIHQVSSCQGGASAASTTSTSCSSTGC